MRTRSPLLVLLALVGLLAGACAGEGKLGGPDIGGTAAAVVGDHAISAAELSDEVEQWAGNPGMLEVLGIGDTGSEGRRSSQLVSFVASHRVVSEQARQLLADAREQADTGELDLAALGVDGSALAEPGDEEVDGIITQLGQQYEQIAGDDVFAAFDEDFQRTLAHDLAHQDRLALLLELGLEAPTAAVNPRYGDAQVLQGGLTQVMPHEGPRAQPLA